MKRWFSGGEIMKMQEFIALLEEVLERDPGTIKSTDHFRDLEGWDSMAMLGFMTLMDEQFSISIGPKQVDGCQTVADLAGLAGGRIL